ncbi:MAG: hypothetical protein ACYC2R_10365 [Burkholderiales bacterium]
MSRLKIFLIQLLVLLQCLVPLLHAHAQGLSIESGIHFHVDLPLQVSLPVDKTQCDAITAVDAPAIGVTQELKRDQLLLLGNAIAVPVQLSPIQGALLSINFILPSESAYSSCFSPLPPSRAPPVSLS